MDSINEKDKNATPTKGSNIEINKIDSDVFECNSVIVEEVDSDVDGSHVLAKVKGEFFVPDGVSRNGRFYPKSLWENVLGDDRVKSYLENRRMFGTISHEQSLDDQALLEGKLSHIVTNLNINENNKGIGEILILDTPAGRILNTIFRAGGKLFVSSRARGSYVKGKRHEGMPIVDPDNYFLETFDFVLDPGFLEAEPKLVESINNIIETEKEKLKNRNNTTNKNETSEGDSGMENKNLINDLNEEKGKIQTQLDDALEEIETLKSDLSVQTDENNHLKEELEKLGNVDKVLKEYKEIGTVKEIETALSEAEDITEAYKELGAPEKISELFDQLEKLGTIEEINKAFDVLEEKVSLYEELGTPEKINKAFDMIEQFHAERQAKEDAEKIAKIAKEHGVDESKVEALWDKMDVKEIEDFFNGLSGKKTETNNKNENKNRIYKKPADSTGSLTEKLKGDKNTNESNSPFKKPLSDRLIEKFS